MAAAASSFDTSIQEGLRLEHLAGKLDSVGNAPEAAARYQKAAALLERAAAVCALEKASEAALGVAKAANQLAGTSAPECTSKAIALYKQAIVVFRRAVAAAPIGSSDAPAVEEHIADLEVRVIYLESLDGCPATVSITEHIRGLRLASSTAASAQALAEVDASVAEVAPQSAGSAIAPTAAPAPQPAVAAAPSSGGGSAVPMIGGKPDFMQGAINLEAQAKQLEAQGHGAAAVDKYAESVQLFAFVVKKEQNEKVKDMIRTRMGEILDRAEALKAKLPT